MYMGVGSFRRRFRFLPFGLILAFSACSSQPANQVATTSSQTAAATQPGGMRSGSDWPSCNGGYDATRYSSLTQINTGNVASLTEVARFKLPECMAFQSGPELRPMRTARWLRR
jgi:glucose dehydrogenase